MFIPYGTDTPIYHWPIVTAVLMVANIFVLVLEIMFPDIVEFGALSHGDGLHPIQWLTSFFMHAGVLHLIGNLIFLWTFGLIVEGKIGPWLLLLVYMAMGIFQNMVEQLLYLPFEGDGSLGASSAIFGLMMIALLWAPQDNVKTIFNPYLFYFYFVNVPIAMMGLLYFLWDFTIAFFTGFSMGTSLLHLMGAATGVGAGLLFLTMGWVDCEQKDIISMTRELFGKAPLKKRKTKSEVQRERDAKKAAILERKKKLILYKRSVDAHLAAGNPRAAEKTFRQIKRLDHGQNWSEPNLLKMIALYQKESDWDQVIEYSNIYIQTYQEHVPLVSINLAKIVLLEKGAPRRAIKALSKIKDPSALTDEQKKTFKQVVSRSKRMIAEGAIELDD